MEHEFWLARWQEKQIGFHQSAAEALLVEHWPVLSLAPGSTVFVPLCGKSLDMVWLADQGHKVIGNELSQIAIDEFFASLGLEPVERTVPGFTIYSSGPYELWCGDFFELPLVTMGEIAGIYDRAALIALPPEMRRRYAAKLSEIGTAKTLLITLEYDQSVLAGPPHAVWSDEVAELFAPNWNVKEITREQTTSLSPKFREKGLESVGQAVHLMTRTSESEG